MFLLPVSRLLTRSGAFVRPSVQRFARITTTTSPNPSQEVRSPTRPVETKSLYDFSVSAVGGGAVSLAEFKSSPVVLVVTTGQSVKGSGDNTQAIESLYERYKHDGFTVLAFPSYNIASEAKRGGTAPIGMPQSATIKESRPDLSLSADVRAGSPSSERASSRKPAEKPQTSFPTFDKVKINGEDAHPLFRWLRERSGVSNLTPVATAAAGNLPAMNYTAYLLVRGQPWKRYLETESPSKIEADVRAALERGDAVRATAQQRNTQNDLL